MNTEEKQDSDRRGIDLHNQRILDLFEQRRNASIQCFPGTGRIDPRSIPGLMDSLATSASPFAPVAQTLVNEMIERFDGEKAGA